MDETFLRYRDPAFRYAKSRNPARVRCRDDALRDGLNCVALAHLMIRDLFGYTLPATFDQAMAKLQHDVAELVTDT
jgi:hypothetical protein